MTAAVLSGKELAPEIRADVTDRTDKLAESGTTVRLAVVIATDDESSAWYVRSIAKAAGKAGIACDVVSEGSDATAGQIREALARLGSDSNIHGIILQTPLPDGVSAETLTPAIPPAKDIDGANPLSLGRLAARLPACAPATAEAVVRLLEHHGVDLAARHAVVVGRSAVVGKPAAHLLLDRDATVTVCHSKTAGLAAITRLGDVLVAAAGRAGPVTTALLLEHTVLAAELAAARP
jgi:methylenetetrahydrofolate dehydrogenase (NADP+)/methenyltetrahydrofolate cyclohydrolase